MIRLLHTADLHLDWPFPSLSAACRTARRREAAGIFGRIVDLAVERGVQAVVAAGDFLQNKVPPLEAEEAVISGCRKLGEHGINVFLAPGHDEAALGVFERLDLPGNVCVLGRPETCVSTAIPGLTVYGFPASQKRNARLLADFHCANHPGLHLGVLHGTYSDLPAVSAEECWWPVSPEDIARSGLDYLALGHYHEQFTCVHGGTPAVYPGSPVRLSFGQQDPRVVLLVELTEGRPSIEPVALRDRAYHEFTFDLSDGGFADIPDRLKEKQDENACVRVILQGSAVREADFFADRLLELCGDLFFHLEVEDRTSVSPGGVETIEGLFAGSCRAAVTAGEDELDYALRAGLVALRGGRLP